MNVQEIINNHNHPEMANQTGHVYMVFEDGEIALQKSGELLWARNLHRTNVPLEHFKSGYSWPAKLSGFGYIFTDRDGAEAVREALEC